MSNSDTDEIAGYLYSRLAIKFPGTKIVKARSTHSVYIYQHLLYATTSNSRYQLKTFTIRVSDHGDLSGTKYQIIGAVKLAS